MNLPFYFWCPFLFIFSSRLWKTSARLGNQSNFSLWLNKSSVVLANLKMMFSNTMLVTVLRKTNIHNIVKYAPTSTYIVYNCIVRLATTSIKQMGQLDK